MSIKDDSARFVKAKFKREERELYDMATFSEGFVYKKSTKMLVGK